MSARTVHGLVLRAGLKGAPAKKRAISTARRQIEDGMQIQIVDELTVYRNLGKVDFLHIPNGSRRSKRQGGTLKKMGMRAGAADLFIWWGDREFGWIELKTEDGTVSDSQKDFAAAVARFNHRHAICRSANEVFATLHAWGCPVQP